MTKKVLTLGLLFVLVVFSSTFVFAESAGNEMQDSWNKTSETMGNVGNAVANTASNVGHAVANTFGMDKNNNNDNNNNSTNNNNTNSNNNSTNGTMGVTTNFNTNTNGTGNYDTARTATTANNNVGGLSNMAWTWIIMGITAAVIVALIWFYATQQNNQTRIKDDN